MFPSLLGFRGVGDIGVLGLGLGVGRFRVWGFRVGGLGFWGFSVSTLKP